MSEKRNKLLRKACNNYQITQFKSRFPHKKISEVDFKQIRKASQGMYKMLKNKDQFDKALVMLPGFKELWYFLRIRKN
jgi:hypothetical protein